MIRYPQTAAEHATIVQALTDARDYIFDDRADLGCEDVRTKIEAALSLLSLAPELRQRESAGEGVTPSRSPTTE